MTEKVVKNQQRKHIYSVAQNNNLVPSFVSYKGQWLLKWYFFVWSPIHELFKLHPISNSGKLCCSEKHQSSQKFYLSTFGIIEEKSNRFSDISTQKLFHLFHPDIFQFHSVLNLTNTWTRMENIDANTSVKKKNNLKSYSAWLKRKRYC